MGVFLFYQLQVLPSLFILVLCAPTSSLSPKLVVVVPVLYAVQCGGARRVHVHARGGETFNRSREFPARRHLRRAVSRGARPRRTAAANFRTTTYLTVCCFGKCRPCQECWSCIFHSRKLENCAKNSKNYSNFDVP